MSSKKSPEVQKSSKDHVSPERTSPSPKLSPSPSRSPRPIPIPALRRTKSQGHLENYITNDLNKYMDETSANRIERVLGKQYSGSVRLYKFPINKCKEIKAYKVLEENKSDMAKQLLEGIKLETKEPMFQHVVSEESDKLFFYKPYGNPFRGKPKSIKESAAFVASADSADSADSGSPAAPFVLFEPEIDFNALSIISHKLAENFARDSGDFEVGPLKDTSLVEFHTYVTMKSTKQLGGLEDHVDDFGGVDYKTITMIWYLVKDKDVDGGNIIFYAPSLTDKQIMEYRQSHGVAPPMRKVKINLWEQMDGVRQNCVCLIFKGDVIHSPEPMGGTGERGAIVFQFIRIDKKDKKDYKDPINWDANMSQDGTILSYEYTNIPPHGKKKIVSPQEYIHIINRSPRDVDIGGYHKRSRRNSKKKKRVRHTRRKQTPRYRRSKHRR